MTPKQPTIITIAAGQPEYLPLPAAVFSDGTLYTEWALTAEELSALVGGGHLRLWVWTFGQPLQPVMFQVVQADGAVLSPPYAGPERRTVVERRRSQSRNRHLERRFANRRRL